MTCKSQQMNLFVKLNGYVTQKGITKFLIENNIPTIYVINTVNSIFRNEINEY